MRKQQAVDFTIYLAVRIVICVVQALSLRQCQHLAKALALLFNDVLKVRRSVVEDNLSHAFPELTGRQRNDLSRAMWSHLFLMICEVALAPRRVHETNWRHHVRFRNKRLLMRTMLENKPSVSVTGHFGNFEMCGFVSGLLGFPTFTIARTLDNPYLHRFLIRFRRSTGQTILPTQGSADEAQEILDNGGNLALLGDHYGGRKGCWVDFFNRPASCHKAIALFALANKAPLMVVHTRRVGGPLQFEVNMMQLATPDRYQADLANVTDITQWYNRLMEKMIRDAPDQYWWLHRRWKDRQDEAKEARATRRIDSATSARPHDPPSPTTKPHRHA